jgi:HAMP domain-containing protein
LQPSFRVKLLLIVGATALALSAVVIGSATSGVRQGRDLASVERRMVPRLLLGPQLEAEFERLRRGMQDAVAAQDANALDESRVTRTRLFELIASAGDALDPHDAGLLRWRIQDYWDKASGVSRRLIGGESGESLVAEMTQMQELQRAAVQAIRKTAGFNREELSATFASIHAANESANEFRLGIGLGGLVLGLGLSLWVSRSMLRGLAELSAGFSRFATGDFSRQIEVTSEDELGHVAREANQMAANLKRLDEHRERSDWLREGQAGLSDELRGELDPAAVATRALWFLAYKVGARIGAIYAKGDDGRFYVAAEYAGRGKGPEAEDTFASGATPSFALGEGLVGQAAAQEEILNRRHAPSFSSLSLVRGPRPASSSSGSFESAPTKRASS